MKIQYLYDQGSSKVREDGLFVEDPFFGVLDATSAPFSPQNPPMLFGGLTGGEMVARTVERSLRSARPSHNLITAIAHANKKLSDAFALFGLQHATVDRSPGTCFAFAKVDADKIEIVQAGDCYAIWVNNLGEIQLTPNQVRLHDAEMNARIEAIMIETAREMSIDLMSCTAEERGRVRQEMWNRFFPILSEARRRDINNPQSRSGYGFLNGQPEAAQMWQSITLPRSETAFLLLCTDGMIPWEAMKTLSDQKIAESLCQLSKTGGLAEILTTARTIEDTSNKKTYLDFAEATAIAIQF